jgi:hypothetical protein
MHDTEIKKNYRLFLENTSVATLFVEDMSTVRVLMCSGNYVCV